MTDRRILLSAVKAFHTLAWFTIEACMLYVLYAGVRGRSDRRTGLAAGVVATAARERGPAQASAGESR